MDWRDYLETEPSRALEQVADLVPVVALPSVDEEPSC